MFAESVVVAVFFVFLLACPAFFVLCLCVVGLAVSVAPAPVSAAVGAADFGMSAAMEPAARPKTNKAEPIRDADLIMESPKQ